MDDNLSGQLAPHVGRIDRRGFKTAHADTMFVHPLFPDLDAAAIRRETFAYPPCWGVLDPGMTMEKHRHPIPEFYVFVQGEGRMTLGEETFDVRSGMAVNIPRDMDHEVANDAGAVQPLIWISVGMSVEVDDQT